MEMYNIPNAITSDLFLSLQFAEPIAYYLGNAVYPDTHRYAD